MTLCAVALLSNPRSYKEPAIQKGYDGHRFLGLIMMTGFWFCLFVCLFVYADIVLFKASWPITIWFTIWGFYLKLD